MTLLGLLPKADEDILETDTKFNKWLAAGDTVDSAVATFEDSSLEDASTLVVAETSWNDTDVKVRWSGGTAGESAKLKIVMTSTNALKKEVTYRVRISES